MTQSWLHLPAHHAAEMAVAAICGCLLLSGCQAEKRNLGASPPITPPTGVADSRARHYETNRYEMSEGGRLFRWQGCDACHTDPAPAYLDLADRAWRRGGTTVQIYRSIAGEPGAHHCAERLTPQQTWQIAGYVHGLNSLKPEQRRRTSDAMRGEPSGQSWQGPLT